MNRGNAMVAGAADHKPVRVRFSGTRRELGLMLVRSYLLLIPTIGLHRFWLTTWKRRFYWSHTEIDGDCLEYTGNASQLLLGFLLALWVLQLLGQLFRPLVHRLQIRQGQFQVQHLQIVHGADRIGYMGDIGIVEAAEHVYEHRRVPNMG